MPDLKSFKISDKEYEKFTHWMKEQKFTYSSSLEKDADQLIKSAKQEKYYPELENQLTQLRNKIEANKATDLTRFKTEISEVLEQQIAFHYALAEGQALVSLGKDKAVLEASRLLDNQEEYKKILSAK